LHYAAAAMARLCNLRARAAALQGGRCIYCDGPMWGCAPDGSDDIDAFLATYGGTARSALRAQCTAEHIVARQDGGRTTAANIAAACRYCNEHRHARHEADPFTDYRRYVRARLAEGRWDGCAWWRLPDPMRGSRPDEGDPVPTGLPAMCGN